MTNYVTVKLTDDQRLFVKYMLEEYIKEHAITNAELGMLNRVYKQIVSYAELVR